MKADIGNRCPAERRGWPTRHGHESGGAVVAQLTEQLVHPTYLTPLHGSEGGLHICVHCGAAFWKLDETANEGQRR